MTSGITRHNGHSSASTRDASAQNCVEHALGDREKCLRHYIALHRLIARLSTCFAKSDAAGLSRSIGHMLAEVGMFTGADRSYLFRFSDDLESADNTHEWCSAGTVPQIHNLKNVPSTTMPWWMEQMKSGRSIVANTLADLPHAASAEKQFLRAQDILSMLAVPVQYGGKLIGFLGFDCVHAEKRWNDADIQLLRTIAEMVGSAVLREQEVCALRESEQRFRSFIESDIIGVVFVDPITGEVTEANDEYLRIIGRSRKELKAGRINWKDITPPEFLEFEKGLPDKFASGENVPAFEKEYLRPDGQRVPVIVAGSFMKNDRQWAVAYVWTTRSAKMPKDCCAESTMTWKSR